MSNPDSHVYLYAKGHYKRKNIIEDLKVIYGVRNGMKPEDMRVVDIALCLLHLIVPYLKDKSDLGLVDFIGDISPTGCWKVGVEVPKRCVPVLLNSEAMPCHTYDSFYEAVIRKCLSILSMTLVSDIPKGLDKSNPNLLPLNKE